MTYYVVWNEDKTEGFISDKFAAHTALTGGKHADDTSVGVSTAADRFHEVYEGSELTMVAVTVTEL